jgi:hypothetical protein
VEKSQAIKIGVFAGVLGLLGISVVCNVVSSDPSGVTIESTRVPFDFWSRWRCLDCGHEFEDYAAVGPRECPSCGKANAYVCIKHQGADGTIYDIAFNYTKRGKPDVIKFPGQAWIPYIDKSVDPPTTGLMDPKASYVLLPVEPKRSPPDTEPPPPLP